MTGPEHYQQAERLIGVAADFHDISLEAIALAQVHATLAHAAATAMGAPADMPDEDYIAWDKACGVSEGGA